MSHKKSSILIATIGLALLGLVLIVPLPKASAPCGEEIVLDWRGRASLFVLGFAALLWATEALPVAFTGLVAVTLLPMLGAMQWDQAVRAGLTSDVIPFLVGIMITSEAIASSGLADRMSRAIAARVGNHPKTAVFILLTTGAALSMCIGNLSAAAVITPLGIALLEANQAPKERSNLGKSVMIACAWGPLIGAVATPAGSTSNVLAMGFLSELAGVNISFVQWMAVALPAALMMIAPAWAVLVTLFPAEPDALDIRMTHESTEASSTLTRDEWSVVAGTAAMWAVWLGAGILERATGMRVSPSLGAILGALVTLSLRSNGINWAHVESSLSIGTIITVASGLSLGSAIHGSTAGKWLASILFSPIIGMPLFPRALLLAASICLLKTMFSSNTATAAILMPVLISLVAGQPGQNSTALWQLVAPAAMATSLSTILTTSSPTGLLAYRAGYFTTADMAKAGLLFLVPASLSLAVACVLLIRG
ncbi:MAG: anion permease [Firmicutes bacterium]|nr:anion permease [Bacillota bacterium]